MTQRRIYEIFSASLMANSRGRFRKIDKPSAVKNDYEFHAINIANKSTAGHIWFICQKSVYQIYGSWSIHGRLPLNLFPMNFPLDAPDRGAKKDEPMNGEMMFVVSLLWNEPCPKGWPLRQSMDETANNIKSLTEMIGMHGVPYFTNIIEQYG
jgi:hypothetical protein